MADLVLPARQCACSVSGKYGWLFFVRLFLLVWTLAIIIAQLAVDQKLGGLFLLYDHVGMVVSSPTIVSSLYR